MPDSGPCTHSEQIQAVTRGSKGCEECIRAGLTWVYLRVCLSCGKVGCCDSSVGQHAKKHARSNGHPIIQSLEPGENWRYCYIDETYVHDPVVPAARGTAWSTWPAERWE